MNFNNGPVDDDLVGMDITDRRRMRGGPDNYEVKDTTGGLRAANLYEQLNNKSEVELLDIDCSTSSTNELDKLAVQATQQS